MTLDDPKHIKTLQFLHFP